MQKAIGLTSIERIWKTPEFVSGGVRENLVVLRPLQKIYMSTHQSDNSAASVSFGKSLPGRTGGIIKIAGIRFIRFPKQHVCCTKIRDLEGGTVFATSPIEGVATSDNATAHHVTCKLYVAR